MTQYVIRNPNNPIVRDLYKDIPLVDSQGNVVTDAQGRIVCDRYVVQGSVGVSEETVNTKIQNLGSNFVNTTSTQTVGGNKSFSGTVTVTTPTKTVDGQTVTDTSDDTTKVANTKFVQAVKSELSADISNIAEKSNAITVSDTAPNIANMPVASGVMHPSQNIITENPDVSILALQQDMWGYKSDKPYTANEYVLYQGNIYKCIQNNTVTVDGETVHKAPTDSNYWIKIATLADLALKADKDFSNVTAPVQAFKNMSIEWDRPDLTAGITINVSTSEQTYICPSDGFVIFGAYGNTGVTSTLSINGVEVVRSASDTINFAMNSTICVPVQKDDVCKFKGAADTSLSLGKFIFYPCKGV